MKIVFALGAMATMGIAIAGGQTKVGAAAAFGPSNPFYVASTLPFHAPPFDRIHDADFEPAIEAGIAQQRAELEAIANNKEAPTFANTIVALEKSGELLTRVTLVFDALTQANTNPVLQALQE